MRLEITGHQVEVSSGLRDHIEEQIKSGVKKFFKEVISVQVVIGRDGPNFSSEIVLNEGFNHHTIVANAIAPEIYAAFDDSAHKMNAQLRKHKDEVLDNRRKDKGDDLDIAEDPDIDSDE